MTATPAEAALHLRQCNPGKTESPGFDDRRPNTTVVHTDYTAPRKGSSDDKSNTTFAIQISLNDLRFLLPTIVDKILQALCDFFYATI